MYTKEEAIKKIKAQVHSKTNFKDYNGGGIIDNTNCLAYAIGATYPEKSFYRLGVLSGLKPNIEEEYKDEEEFKELFFKDIESLDIDYQEIEFIDKFDLLDKVSKLNLKDNEHVVVLCACYFGCGMLKDFHFYRFDKEMGWSEKRRCQYYSKNENIERSWTDFNRPIGLYVLKA